MAETHATTYGTLKIRKALQKQQYTSEINEITEPKRQDIKQETVNRKCSSNQVGKKPN